MEKTKLTNLIGKLYKIAKEQKWEKTYNKESDFFEWSKPQLSEDAHFVKLCNEIGLFVSSQGIEGLGVEYLTNNFIQHNEEYKDLPQLLSKKIDEDTFTVPKNKEKKAEQRFKSFAKDLGLEILKESFEKGRNIKEMDDLVKLAMSSKV